MKTKMKRIAIDVDEVLVPMLPAMLKWRKPKCPIPLHYPYVYRKIWDISEEESQKMVREFYETKEFVNLQPLAYSQEAMIRLKKAGNAMYIMTGRQDIVREKTEEWVEKNFPGIFTDVILTNSYTPRETSKATMCSLLSIDTLVDDNLNACFESRDAGVHAVNFIGDPVYPWCFPNRLALNSWKPLCGTLPETPKTFSEPFSKNLADPAFPRVLGSLDPF
jgi:5'(3')-deoxyribonucleotidase